VYIYIWLPVGGVAKMSLLQECRRCSSSVLWSLWYVCHSDLSVADDMQNGCLLVTTTEICVRIGVGNLQQFGIQWKNFRGPLFFISFWEIVVCGILQTREGITNFIADGTCTHKKN